MWQRETERRKVKPRKIDRESERGNMEERV